jgi:penicillin-binding protein 1B
MRVRTWMRGKSKIHLAKSALLFVALGSAAAVSLEAVVRARLSDSKLSAPTRFYARPIVLEPGMDLFPARVESSLKRLGYEKATGRNVGIGEYRFDSRSWTIGRRAFRIYDQVDNGGVAVVRLGYGNRVSDIRTANGTRISSLALEPEVIRSIHGSAYEDRTPITLSSVPKHLLDAILAIEDQRFFEHDGLDPRRVGGAAIANVRARRIVQGASTITQQLAKNLFLSPRRSLTRKLREVAMALTLELRYSKDEILEAYLNEVYLGQNGALAIHGVGRAAQFYFGKDVSQLSIGESAMIAGIIRGPSLYSPFRNPDTAKDRRDLVLNRMLALNMIAESTYSEASGELLGLRSKPLTARSGRYFIDYAAEQLRSDLGKSAEQRGLSVFTTLDMELQQAAEKAVHDGLVELERYYPRLANDSAPLQAALVALDPRTGAVLAMVGGRDYGFSQFNRAVQARRQPGSSFKPIVALAALTLQEENRENAGPQFTLASILDDRPLSVQTPAGLWEPDNYDGLFRGPVTLREAIEGSLNVPFARLGMAVGPENIVQTAQTLGIQNYLNPVLSLALGSSEVSPLELTQAYNVLAAGGYRADLNAIVGVLGRESQVVSRRTQAGEQVFDPAETYLVTSALRGAVERGTGRSLRSLGVSGPVAAKSGTTNQFRDAWFIGYTPSLTVGVWVGFDDGRSIGLSGSRAALPIFGQFLVDAKSTYGGAEFDIPYGLEVADVNHETGLLGGPGCGGEPEVFLSGTAPENSCSPYWGSTRRYRGSSSTTSSSWSRRMAPLLRELERRLTRGTN